MAKAKNISLKKVVGVVKKNKRFLLVTHEHPDGDGLGSILALGLGLKKLGKEVTLYCKDPLPKMYAFLPHAKKIKKHFPKHKKFDVTFMADLGERERIGESFLKYPGKGLVVSLDHHIKGEHNADLNFCLPHQASTGEVIYKILKALKIGLDRAIATAIYTAIVTDTGSFKYSNTTRETFQHATELMNYKVDVWQVARHCFETFSLARMELLKRIMANMQIHKNKKIAWVVLKQKDFRETQASPDEAEGFINIPRSIETVEVAIAFKEQKKGFYKVSLRSKNYVDVADIAQKLGGGGHIRASGFKMEGSLETVRGKVLQAILKKL